MERLSQIQQINQAIMFGNFTNDELNSIGGGDIMFFAFKEEADYMWFTLTWQ